MAKSEAPKGPAVVTFQEVMLEVQPWLEMEVRVLSVEVTGREPVGHSKGTSIVRRAEVKSRALQHKG